MSKSPSKPDDSPTPPDRSPVVLLLGAVADTTWRMFVPTIGLTVAGVMSDNWLDTTPWLTLVGIISGVGVTALLITKQFKKL